MCKEIWVYYRWTGITRNVYTHKSHMPQIVLFNLFQCKEREEGKQKITMVCKWLLHTKRVHLENSDGIKEFSCSCMLQLYMQYWQLSPCSFHAYGCVCRCYASTTSRTTHQVLAIVLSENNKTLIQQKLVIALINLYTVIVYCAWHNNRHLLIHYRCTYVYLASNSRYPGACLSDASMTVCRLSCNLL